MRGLMRDIYDVQDADVKRFDNESPFIGAEDLDVPKVKEEPVLASVQDDGNDSTPPPEVLELLKSKIVEPPVATGDRDFMRSEFLDVETELRNLKEEVKKILVRLYLHGV